MMNKQDNIKIKKQNPNRFCFLLRPRGSSDHFSLEDDGLLGAGVVVAASLGASFAGVLASAAGVSVLALERVPDADL